MGEGSNNTWEDVNLTISGVTVVQDAYQPQYNHRVDGQNVTDMLIEVEVLEQKPGNGRRQEELISLLLLMYHLSGTEMKWHSRETHQTTNIIRSSSSDSMAQSHRAEPVWCCKNIVRFSSVKRVPNVAYNANPFCTWCNTMKECHNKLALQAI